MGKYRYRAFGLNIASDFRLPELMEGSGSEDVGILKGIIDVGDYDLSENIIFKESREESIYQIKKIARCKIIKGETAIIMPDPFLSDSTLRLLILTSVFGCVFIQRRMVPIHGSCVVIGKRSIVIMGSSGAGKSSLAGTFIKEGCKFLSDDVSVISENALGKMLVQPGYPYRKLHQDSAEYHSLDYIGFERIEFEEEKYLIPQHDSFMAEPAELGAFFEIAPGDVDDVTIEKIKGMAKLDVLMRNIYRWKLIGYHDLNAYYYQKMGNIASRVDVFKITRPKGGFSCERQIKLILKELGL